VARAAYQPRASGAPFTGKTQNVYSRLLAEHSWARASRLCDGTSDDGYGHGRFRRRSVRVPLCRRSNATDLLKHDRPAAYMSAHYLRDRAAFNCADRTAIAPATRHVQLRNAASSKSPYPDVRMAAHLLLAVLSIAGGGSAPEGRQPRRRDAII